MRKRKETKRECQTTPKIQVKIDEKKKNKINCISSASDTQCEYELHKIKTTVNGSSGANNGCQFLFICQTLFLYKQQQHTICNHDEKDDIKFEGVFRKNIMIQDIVQNVEIVTPHTISYIYIKYRK